MLGRAGRDGSARHQPGGIRHPLQRHLDGHFFAYYAISHPVAPSDRHELAAGAKAHAGLFTFFYVVLHFLSYVWLDQWFDWSAIFKDVVKHCYVLVGFAASLLLLP